MKQLQHSRKSEVKQLALVHKDKDELERMKREVASTVVEKGVAERVRLTANYEKRRDELQKQHDIVRTTLQEQKEKVGNVLLGQIYLVIRKGMKHNGFLKFEYFEVQIFGLKIKVVQNLNLSKRIKF
jgi:hypothetical protein